MKKRDLLRRGICLLVAAVLLLILCSAGHDCVDDHCSVCQIVSAWKLIMPALALAAGVLALPIFVLFYLHGETCALLGWEATLVALKVKLSD